MFGQDFDLQMNNELKQEAKKRNMILMANNQRQLLHSSLKNVSHLQNRSWISIISIVSVLACINVY